MAFHSNNAVHSRSFIHSQRSAFNPTAQGHSSAHSRSNRSGFGYSGNNFTQPKGYPSYQQGNVHSGGGAAYNMRAAGGSVPTRSSNGAGSNNISIWNSAIQQNPHINLPPSQSQAFRSYPTVVHNQRLVPQQSISQMGIPPALIANNMPMQQIQNYERARGGQMYEGQHFEKNRGQQYEQRRPISVRQAPVNHTWQQESTAETVQNYTASSLVLWSSKMCGEVLCDRNIENGGLHFCFDGRTVIGDKTVALLARVDEEFCIRPGTKVEIEACYLPVDMCDPLVHHIVFIQKMAIVAEAPAMQEQVVSVLTSEGSPTEAKLGTTLSGDQVMIPPGLFLKDIIEQSLRSMSPLVQLRESHYATLESVLEPHRTVTGHMMRAPRWIGDVMGDRANVKRIMLTCQPYGEIRHGFATIQKVVPNQCIMMSADEFPEELIFLPTVDLPREFKARLVVGCRVHVVACPNLPGLSCPWRAMVVKTNIEYGAQIPPAPLRPTRLDGSDVYQPDIANPGAPASGANLLSSPAEPPLIGIEDEPETERGQPSAILSMSSLSSQSCHLRELTEVFLDFSMKDLQQGSSQLETGAFGFPETPLVDLGNTQSPSTQLPPVNNIKEKKEEKRNPFDQQFTVSNSSCSVFGREGEEEDSGIFGSPVSESVVERCDLVTEGPQFRFGDEVHCHLVVDPEKPVFRKESKKKKKNKAAKKSTSALDDLLSLELGLTSPATSLADVPQKEQPAGTSMSFLDAPVEDMNVNKVLLPDQSSQRASTSTDPDPNGVVRWARPSEVFSQLIGNNPALAMANNTKENEAIRNSFKKDEDSSSNAIRCVGLFDDISLVLEDLHSTEKQPRKKKSLNDCAAKEEKPLPVCRGNDKFWFRRRQPRLLPTVVVAEFILNRNEEEDWSKDVDVNSLEKTVVLRNKRAVPEEPVASKSKQLSQPKEVQKKENVDPKKSTSSEKVAMPAAKSKVAEMIMNDNVFGAFFGPLLQKKA